MAAWPAHFFGYMQLFDRCRTNSEAGADWADGKFRLWMDIEQVPQELWAKVADALDQIRDAINEASSHKGELAFGEDDLEELDILDGFRQKSDG